MIFVNSWFEIDEAADCLGAIPRNINLRFQGYLYEGTTQTEDEAVRKRLFPVQFASGQHKLTHCLPTAWAVEPEFPMRRVIRAPATADPWAEFCRHRHVLVLWQLS